MDFYDKYDERFFNIKTPTKVVPLLLNKLPIKINSVIDLGCGKGTWLQAFKQNGIKRVLGVDGEHININDSYLEKSEFFVGDLNKFDFEIKEKFDIAISLEVAEHLKKENAKKFILNLCNLSSVILFSAAIPGQEGYKHINCQWPEYWITLFKEQGFEVLDIIREDILFDKEIEYWYRQNILLFTNNAKLLQYYKNKIGFFSEIVTKELYLNKINELDKIKTGILGVKFGFKILLKALKNKFLNINNVTS